MTGSDNQVPRSCSKVASYWNSCLGLKFAGGLCKFSEIESSRLFLAEAKICRYTCWYSFHLSWISQSVLMGGGSSACRDPHQGRSVSLAPVVPPGTRLHQGKALRSSCHTSGKHQEYTRVQLKSWFSEETSGALSASYKHWNDTSQKNLLPRWNHWCATTSSSMRITPEHQSTIERLNYF